MLVRVSIRKRGEHAVSGALRYFARLPVIGEFLALSAGGQMYQVEHLVHCPFPCGWSAELFAVEVDHNAIRAQVFADAKGSTNHIAEDDPDLQEVKPKLMDRLVFEPHSGQWLRETLDESGQIYDFVEISARGASIWLEQTLNEGKRIFDLFDPDGASPISKDELVAVLREAADELEEA